MNAVFSPISYERWVETMMESMEEDAEVDCPDCNGSGESECCECGHEKVCDTCSESGKVGWGELTKQQQQAHLSKSIYVSALLKDADDFAKWVGGSQLTLLAAAGYAPRSLLPSKRLSLEWGIT